MLENPPFDLPNLPPYIKFRVDTVPYEDIESTEQGFSRKTLVPDIIQASVTWISPTGGIWEENSEALGLLISDVLKQMQSSKYTEILYAEGVLSNDYGNLVPLLPYIFHGGRNGRFHMAEALHTQMEIRAAGPTLIGFEYNPVQFEQLMKNFHGNAFRLDTDFGGALWPNKKLEDGLRLDFFTRNSMIELSRYCPLWFQTNRDFDSWSVTFPSKFWQRKFNKALKNSLAKVGTQSRMYKSGE